jgi:hypothetical protein
MISTGSESEKGRIFLIYTGSFKIHWIVACVYK